MGKNNKKNIIIISVVSVLIIALIVIGIVLIKGSNKDDVLPSDGTVIYSSEYDNTTKEQQSEYNNNTTFANNNDIQSNDLLSIAGLQEIEAFLSGNYYLSCSMVTDGTSTPITMAMNGSDFEVLMKDSGLDMAFMYTDGKIYLLNPANDTYCEFSSTLMSLVGMKKSDIDEMVKDLDFSDQDYKQEDISETTLDGKTVTCVTLSAANGLVKFYMDGDNMKQIDTCKADETVTSTIIIDEFSATIPSGMLTLSGKTEQNVMAFVSGLAS